MKMIKRVLVGVAAACLAGLAGGCEGFNVHVLLDKNDPGLKDAKGTLKSIEVNIVAVNDTELPRWEQMSMSSYWEPDNPIRKSAVKYVMTFGEKAPEEQLLKKTDPIWQTWKERKATQLLILAFLPGIADQPGKADPRRVILTLDSSKWENRYWGNDTIKIQLGSGGLTPLRQPNK
jgi:hypothetical protein